MRTIKNKLSFEHEAEFFKGEFPKTGFPKAGFPKKAFGAVVRIMASLALAFILVAPDKSPIPSTVSKETALSNAPYLSIGTNTATLTGTASAKTGTVRIKAVGDVMLARSVGRRLSNEGWHSVFGPGASLLADADILVANLECCISERGQPEKKRFTFRADPGSAKALANAGFAVVSLANNHAMDYGAVALADTVSLLDAAGVAHAGAGSNREEAHRPAIIVRNGVRVAFLAYVGVPVESGGFDIRSWAASESSPGLALADPDEIRKNVAAAAGQADAVVVLLHAGQEGSSAITAAQTKAARAAIEAGACLVIGSHPHVIQTVEPWEKGIVAWSLGNWIFDGFDDMASSGAVLDAVISTAPRDPGAASSHKAPSNQKARVVSASLLYPVKK